MSPELIARLRKLAEGDSGYFPEHFNSKSSDDAYYGGFSDGQAYLAREILKELPCAEPDCTPTP